jgi:hypothetical protein
MPSPEHAADLERVLTRAAEECESGIAWFGEGLPRALKRAIEATGEATGSAAGSREPDVAFVEVGAELSEVPTSVRRIVAVSSRGLEDLATLIQLTRGSKPSIGRLICPVAVLDFTTDRVRVREIRHGLTAADLQRRAGTTLWSGPDLKELGSH